MHRGSTKKYELHKGASVCALPQHLLANSNRLFRAVLSILGLFIDASIIVKYIQQTLHSSPSLVRAQNYSIYVNYYFVYMIHENGRVPVIVHNLSTKSLLSKLSATVTREHVQPEQHCSPLTIGDNLNTNYLELLPDEIVNLIFDLVLGEVLAFPSWLWEGYCSSCLMPALDSPGTHITALTSPIDCACY